MPVKLTLSSHRPDEWYVTLDGTYIVGFAGPLAHSLAVRQQQELSALLNGAAAPPGSTDPPSAAIRDSGVIVTSPGKRSRAPLDE